MTFYVFDELGLWFPKDYKGRDRMSCKKLTSEGKCSDSKGSQKLPRCIEVSLEECDYESPDEKLEKT